MQTKLISILLIIIGFYGCTTTKTSLQEISVEQTLMNLPTRITENNKAGDVLLSLNFSGFRQKNTFGNINGHTDVNENGFYEVEKISDTKYLEHAGVNTYKYTGNNFHINLPEFSIAGNIDLIASKYFCFFGGVSYNHINDEENWSKYFGIGFYNELPNFGYRIDFGLINYSSNYNINYVKVEDKIITGDMTRDVWFYEKQQSNNYWGTFLSFTYNTKRSDWFVNLFANYTVGIQVLYEIELPVDLSTDKYNFNLSTTVHNFSLGVFQKISESIRFSLGAKYLKYKIDNSKADNLNYFSQLDFML